MFTGLIADLGRVSELQDGGDGVALRIQTRLATELRQGDSIAVNGVCLTATSLDADGFQAQAMIQTLRSSSLGELRTGSTVNLELPMRPVDRLGGHIVQGHVDGLGAVVAVTTEGFSRVVEIDVDSELRRYLVEKGSVAVDGVSLTISSLTDEGFAVSLIPETLTRTTLGALAPGAKVNIEVDVLAKHVERLMGAHT
jgi:riboflavin synthase